MECPCWTLPVCWLLYVGLICEPDWDQPQSQHASVVWWGDTCCAHPELAPCVVCSMCSGSSPVLHAACTDPSSKLVLHTVHGTGMWHRGHAACRVILRPMGQILGLHGLDPLMGHIFDSPDILEKANS